MSAENKIISIKDLHKQYGNLNALNGLNIDVFTGDTYGFLGPNGAGKSTTIRILLGLVKSDSGTIEVFNRSLSTERNFILSQIGSIVERPDFYGYLSAEKNLILFS